MFFDGIVVLSSVRDLHAACHVDVQYFQRTRAPAANAKATGTRTFVASDLVPMLAASTPLVRVFVMAASIAAIDAAWTGNSADVMRAIEIVMASTSAMPAAVAAT